MEKFIAILNKLGTCEEAMEWLSSQTSLQQAWGSCERGDWMLWLITALKMNERKLSLTKGRVAKEVVHLMNDEKSIAAVQAAIDYGNEEISRDELEKATIIAYVAVSDALATNIVAHAEFAAAYATTIADTTASSAAVAYATAADTAAATADNATSNISYDEALKKSAEIIKTIVSFNEVKAKVN